MYAGLSWAVAPAQSGRREAWDSRWYWDVTYPLCLALAASLPAIRTFADDRITANAYCPGIVGTEEALLKVAGIIGSSRPGRVGEAVSHWMSCVANGTTKRWDW